ncbi:hypothetical protein ACOMHN_028759 [Nucella lapillus]
MSEKSDQCHSDHKTNNDNTHTSPAFFLPQPCFMCCGHLKEEQNYRNIPTKTSGHKDTCPWITPAAHGSPHLPMDHPTCPWIIPAA